MGLMETLPLTDAKANLSSLVDLVTSTNDRVTITRHGKPAAVIVSTDDLESIEETLYWLTVPGIHESVTRALVDLESGNYSTTIDDARARIAAERERLRAQAATW